MKFAIVSLPRCGSTAVYRVLGTDPTTAIMYEPPFFGVGIKPGKVRKKALACFAQAEGIKHVWDPNGWPFRNPDHASTLEVLARSDELIAPNQAVLDCADKVIFLRRRNAFARTLSDLWGQQTHLWGHDPHQRHDPSEVEKYRAAAHRRVASAIDPEVFGWYMRHADEWEDEIVGGLSTAEVRTFFYEDLFDPALCRTGIPQGWREMAEWLDLNPQFESSEVRQILSPESKLNSEEIYARIPNFEDLKAVFLTA